MPFQRLAGNCSVFSSCVKTAGVLTFNAEVEAIRCIEAVLSAYRRPALIAEVETVRWIRVVLFSAHLDLLVFSEVETVRCVRVVLSGLRHPW